MVMRSVVSRARIGCLMEVNWRSSASSLRYFSDDRGRILSEEERAKETVYIQKMERERLEKKRKKEQEKAEREKAEKAGEEAQKS